jgi:hypothetical protein
MVEHLPHKCGALSSNPNATKKKKKKRKRKKEKFTKSNSKELPHK